MSVINFLVCPVLNFDNSHLIYWYWNCLIAAKNFFWSFLLLMTYYMKKESELC